MATDAQRCFACGYGTTVTVTRNDGSSNRAIAVFTAVAASIAVIAGLIGLYLWRSGGDETPIAGRTGDGASVSERNGDDEGAEDATESPSTEVPPETPAPTDAPAPPATQVTASASTEVAVVLTSIVPPAPTAPPLPTATLPTATVPPPPPPPPAVVEGDLGIAGHAMEQPECDGGYIVSVGSFVTPANYVREVGEMLARAPGAWYLRTDRACTSLRQVMPDGSAIYMTVYGPYPDLASACAQVPSAQAITGSAFARQLINTADGQPLPNADC